MNIWLQKSIELANQSNYLDLLYKIYPMSSNLRRELSKSTKDKIRNLFLNQETKELFQLLLKQEIFPIKDSYVAYLKIDKTAIDRNPNTVNRLMNMIYSMDLEDVFDKLSTPKETNRQIGPLFKNWLNQKTIGCEVTDNEEIFLKYHGNIIFNSSVNIMKEFAHKHLGYDRNKGLDFIAKFNNKYIIGEAKFITHNGGHQNAQYADAIATLKSKLRDVGKVVIPISILDGVLFIKRRNKMHKELITDVKDEIILSSVLLCDFLYSL